MDEFVRAGADADLPALAGLETEARAAVAGAVRGGAQWLATHPCLGPTGWQVRLADPGWVTVVSGADDQILGMATMRLPVGRLRPVAEVEGIYVTPDARELGLGELLLETLLARATEAGAGEIDATALPGDRETKNLFERFGLTARLIVVNKRL